MPVAYAFIAKCIQATEAVEWTAASRPEQSFYLQQQYNQSSRTLGKLLNSHFQYQIPSHSETDFRFVLQHLKTWESPPDPISINFPMLNSSCKCSIPAPQNLTKNLTNSTEYHRCANQHHSCKEPVSASSFSLRRWLAVWLMNLWPAGFFRAGCESRTAKCVNASEKRHSAETYFCLSFRRPQYRTLSGVTISVML